MDFKTLPINLINPYQGVGKTPLANEANKISDTSFKDELISVGQNDLVEVYVNRVKNMNDVNFNKVNAIKAKILNGEYSVDSYKLAQAIVGYSR